MAAMRNLLFLFFSIFFLLQLHSSAAQTPVKAGYWFRASEFPVSEISSDLFTHLFCAFAVVDTQTNQLTINPQDQPSFSTFTQTVQQKNPSVKTLLSIGGGGGEAVANGIASMASQPSSRKAFIDSSIKLARDNGFHGLDLDWEYPKSDSEMVNLGTLLDEWRAAVQGESSSTGREALLLTAAVYFSSVYESANYQVASLAKNLDFVNVMAYDFKGPSWSGSETGAPAALNEPSSRFSGSAGIEVWTGAGMPAQKLVFGMPFYGYAWNLVDPATNGIGAPATGVATGDGIDKDSGAITYNQIKAFIQRTGATKMYDANRVTNYCYSGSTWIGYDDVESIDGKVSFAKGKGLLGYFFWSVSGDDNWTLSRTASATWSR